MEKALVMIVDDEHLVRWSLKKELSDEGFLPIPVESGEEALEKVKEQEPDVILLDVRLPGIDGFEVLEELNKAGVQSKVIMITAYVSDETLQKALAAGAVDFICKPFHMEEVKLRIFKSLQEKVYRNPSSSP